MIGIFQVEIGSSLQGIIPPSGPRIYSAYASDKMRKLYLTCCKSSSEDGTLLHLALSHFVRHPHSHPFVDPNRRASWTPGETQR